MTRLLRWCVPATAFWSRHDQIAVWYENHWITVEPKRRLAFMAIYGVSPR